jgi:hypothetical protein
MRARGAAVGKAAAIGFGIFLIVTGALAAESHWSAAGVVVLAGMCVGWFLSQRQQPGVPSESVFEVLTQQNPPPDEARGRELLAMLEEWEALEEKRGTPEFDPWALQALRNDIRKVVDSDPALSQLFSELQRAA